jgi:putative endonuclease
MEPSALGTEGEALAAAFLEQKGYKILEKNAHARVGEIDLIAFDPRHQETVFVEVKTRKSEALGTPEESVTPSKLQKIIKTAELWRLQHKKEGPYRIDLIAILMQMPPQITHLENIS